MQHTRVLLCLIVASLLGCCLAVELFPFNPVAHPKAMVHSGNARFTVLTDHIIRMEYSNNGRFEDRATLAFLNRNTPVPNFQVQNTAGGFILTTSHLQLQYTGGVFSASSLSVKPRLSFGLQPWHYGQLDTGNLFGTIKSLDDTNVITLNCSLISNVIVNGESLHCEYGLISRDGWRIVNDTSNWGLTSVNAASSPQWWDSVNTDNEDLYFFGHGHNYKLALQEFTLLSNPISMVPRYASGIWWSRWYNLNNWDVHSIVGEYEKHDLPLDVFVLDMDWHTKQGWGGYSFDERLFPNPANTLGWLHNEKGIYTSTNLHDDDGIRNTENTYRAMANYMGYPSNSQNTIPFEICTRNSTYILGVEDIAQGANYRAGVDVAWIDYQQGGTQGSCTGLTQNPTIMLSHVRGTNNIRRRQNVRDLVLARWGGLGNHRYQVGFSGDVGTLNWADLAFQPYFSMTASNVGFGFWSHDLVGPYNDHELHTRWLQWGAVSAVFRTHDRGMASGSCANNDPNQCAIVEIWKLPQRYFVAARAALHLREKWIPVLYNAVRHAFDTGVSAIRPMYYNYPEDNAAYQATAAATGLNQYFFCSDDIIISPITVPASTTNMMASKTVWVPTGQWYEATSGLVRNGGSTVMVTKNYDLTEIPIYIRAGAVIPEIHFDSSNMTGIAMRQYSPLVFSVYVTGANSGSGSVYEDDGMTLDYVRNNAFARTTLHWQRASSNRQITMTIASTGNMYNSFPRSRSIHVKLFNTLPASSVTVNGQAARWRYDAQDLCLIVHTADHINTFQTVSITVTFVDAVQDNILAGLKGLFHHANLAKSVLDPTWATPGSGSVTGGNISVVASMPKELDVLAYTAPHEVLSHLNSVRTLYGYAIAEVNAIKEQVQPEMLLNLRSVPESKKRIVMEKLQGQSDVEMTAAQRKAYALALLNSAN